MLKVRRAAERDAERAHQLIEKLEAPRLFPYEPFVKNYLKNLADPDVIYLVGENDAGVIAFGSLHISTPLHHDRPVAEIMELIVDEQNRGRSVGAQLINAMMLLARDRGCCSLEVTSSRTCKRAHRFYAKHGFQLTHYEFAMNMDIGVE